MYTDSVRRFKSGTWAVTLLAFLFMSGGVNAATSANYNLTWDSINSGGSDITTSTNYQLRDTAGEQALGDSSSTSYQAQGGYRAGDDPPPAPVSSGGGSGVSAPIISSVTAVSITKNSARITWTTDKDSNSSVSYGVTLAYASGTVSDAALVTSHAVTLTGLTPNSTYHYSVTSVDITALSRSSADYTFITLADTSAPKISNLRVASITETAATVLWDTDKAASSLVTYGPSASYGSTATAVGLTPSHSVALTSLRGGTVYHFFITTVDTYGNVATSTDATWLTLADTTPPSNVFGLTASPGDKQVALTWNNPTESDFAGTRLMRKIGGFPSNSSDGVVLVAGLVSSRLDTGLTNGVKYYYGAYAYDASGNFASGALTSATPVGPALPPPTTTSTIPVPKPSVLPTPTSTSVTPTSTVSPISTPSPVPTPVVTPTPTSTPISTLVLSPKLIPTSVIFPVPEVLSATGTLEKSESEKIDVTYFGLAGDVALEPDAARYFGVLVGSPILARVSIKALRQPVVAGFISVGEALYSLQLTPDKTALTGAFTIPTAGIISSTVVLSFESQTRVQHVSGLRVQSGGRIIEETWLGAATPAVIGAKLQLFRQVNGVWEPYGLSQSSGADGAYGYVVPNGRYYLEVGAPGYRKRVSDPVSIEQNVYNQSIALIPLPVLQTLKSDAPLAQNVAILAQNVVAQATYSTQVVKQVIQSPQVQATNAVAAPVALTVSLVNTASTISLFNVFTYLQYLFTQPLLLLGRRKRKQWGAVFNALTKQPVDLVIVRLLQAETQLVVQTRVTDKFGRYAFIAKPGNYRLEVVKPGYVFPSQYLVDRSADVEFTDLYHGDTLTVETSFVISPNIPLDPATRAETPSVVLWKRTLQKLHHAAAFSAIPLGMVAVVVTPSMPNALLLLAQIGVYFLFRRLALPTKAKSWGIAFELQTRQPMAGVIIRIFDKKFNKLLETQVTDKNGKYGFLVRRNLYYVTAEKEGYKPFTSPDIDLLQKDEAFVDQNLPLERMM